MQAFVRSTNTSPLQWKVVSVQVVALPHRKPKHMKITGPSVYLFCYILSLLPLRFLYGLSDALFVLVYYVLGYRKKIVATNIQNAFPAKCMQERNDLEKAFYRHLCDLCIEQVKALSIKPCALNKRVTIDHTPLFEEFYKKNQSILLVAGHLGNWEWTAHVLALQTPYTVCAAYQPLHQHGMNQMALCLRTRFQRKAIPMHSIAQYLLRYKGPAQAVSFLIDQAPFNTHTCCWTTFLGQPTAVAVTAAKLAQKCNLPIFYMETHQIKRGHYRIRPILLTAAPHTLSVQEIACSYTQQLEADILRNPSIWLWSHRRWK